MNQKPNSDPSPIPEDATKTTEYQREEQDQLDHQRDDPNALGTQQSGDDIADESSR